MATRGDTRFEQTPESVLVIGSGPIVIGQAAEFDYAGSQACRALREDGVRTILVNSNPATIMTDEDVADAVYIEPLTPDVIRRVIQREKPDGLLPTLGGQTGLNLAVKVAELGILDQYGVRLLGTPLKAIQEAEDRALFKNLLQRIGEPAIPSVIVHSLEEAREFAKTTPLPLVIRPAYTLGGTGGGVAHTPDGTRPHRHLRPQRQPDPPDPARTLPHRLEGNRVRGDARQRRHLHHHLQHGKLRPDGRPHRRQHRRRAVADAVGPRVPDAAHPRRSTSSARSASRAAATSSTRSTPTRWTTA